MKDDLEHGWLVNDIEEEAEQAFTCDWCGEPIYDGDEYYDLGGERVCSDCIRNCQKMATK